MIVYLETKKKFNEDILSNRIEDLVRDAVKSSLGHGVSDAEIRSWKNSLRYMNDVIADPDIPDNAGVAIEYAIPSTSRRVDFILTGTREDGDKTAVIVELKQWESAELTEMDAIVSTFVGGGVREVNHPSYQAWSYSMLIEDFNETVRKDPIHLQPCAYLHNYEADSAINHSFYKQHTDRAPVFLKDDALKLREFIKKHVKKGDNGDTMYRIRDGKIRPSKSLADHLSALMKGKEEFYMIDDQKFVYETALHLSKIAEPGHKKVLIVEGGPGTGKSVVAINLLVSLINQWGKNARYVTKNSAPRAVFEAVLAGTLTKSRISSLFVGSGKFTNTSDGEFDTLIVDEAHRLNEKSGLFANMGENQIKEIIHSSNCSIFFIDECQKIHWKDIGQVASIIHFAGELGADVVKLKLASQFRCNGSDGYLSWVDNTLAIQETANPTLENINYEFKVCSTATEMRDLIYDRNKLRNKARMVAGYCWKWITKKQNPNGYDIVFAGDGFAARWNLTKDGSLWIIKPESVSEVGCIHTCQGLELDYVGVIIGPDFLVRNGEVITDGAKRASGDRSIAGYKKLLKSDPSAAQIKADEIIKNTYRTLMTRGLKGCYVYSPDPETNAYLAKVSKGAMFGHIIPPLSAEAEEVEHVDDELPFETVPTSNVIPYQNAVPVIDLEIAAGSFSTEQWTSGCEWAKLPEPFTAKPGYFIAQVIGESMNKKIPNGAWCIFKHPEAGSRNGKVVIAQSGSVHLDDSGNRYTVKVYHSEKTQHDETWTHTKITLSPQSSDASFQPIVLTKDQLQDFSIVGELVAILG